MDSGWIEGYRVDVACNQWLLVGIRTVRMVTVWTTSSMHLLTKPVTDVVFSSMPLEEHIPVCAKESCSLASASTGGYREDRRIQCGSIQVGWRDTGLEE